jgi:putative transposase
MQKYRKTSHNVYDLKYHIVWITKYRKAVLVGPIAERVGEIIRQICQQHDIEILKGHVGKDHVHLFVSIPPQVSVSAAVQAIKGKSSWKMLAEFKGLSREFWGRHFWARGYFAASSGNVTDEMILEYISNQEGATDDGEFTITSA